MVFADQAPGRAPSRPAAADAGLGRLADLLIAGALFVLAATILLQAAETAPFHGDESEWISAGRYFQFVFLDHDVTSEVWRPSWLNRDQPPLGRYIVGGIVWASGTDPNQVNRTYGWERDYETNLREGRVPAPSILMPVRRTMAIVGAISIVLLFVAGRIVGGTVVGAVAGLVATSSPLLQSYFVQARTEALLATFSALALVALLAFARRYQLDGGISWVGWSVGPVVGLALATKLTAALAIVGACAYGGVAGLARTSKSPREAIRLVGWSVATGLLAAVVWVGVNPFLWPDPVGRTWSMLAQQQAIMVQQGSEFGNPVELALPGRLLLTVQRSFVENSTPAFDYGAPRGSEPLIRRTFSELPTVFGISAELALAAIGLAVLSRRGASVWWSGQRHGAETALLWWLGAYFLGIAVNLSLDWPRYYVPTAFYGTILIGMGAQAIVAVVMRLRPWAPRVSPRTVKPRVEAAG
jgi:hypothetical protein